MFRIRRWSERVKFNLNTVNENHGRVTYRGVPMIKCPFDYVIYQMILNDVKPDLVIEIGTNTGGCALYLADIVEKFGGQVHTIDIEKRIDPRVLGQNNIKYFTDGYEGYDLRNAANFKNILVIDDGSHQYQDVLDALKKFSPIIATGSYFIVEDGIINEIGEERRHHGGPLKAIREFMKGNREFIVDRSWCDFFGVNATFNVNGYLKKI